MTLLRTEMGAVLRAVRLRDGRTLRDVSTQAGTALGYLSEVERGGKEASSEILAAICAALGVTQSSVLATVADRMRATEHRCTPTRHRPRPRARQTTGAALAGAR